MRFLDMHCHILPAVDDGAQDTDMAIELLELMARQGVTHALATPHFYPMQDNIEEFVGRIYDAYVELARAVKGKDLPQIYLGCEVHYFRGIGKSESIKKLTIQNTDYLLLELPYNTAIDDAIIRDIILLREDLGIIPILAHIERYAGARGYKKLLALIKNGVCLAHINAHPVTVKEQFRVCEKLLKGGFVSFIASDAHSPDWRPPLTQDALKIITEKMGRLTAGTLTRNSIKLLEEIEGKNEE